MELPGYAKRWALAVDDEGCAYLHNLIGPDQPYLHDHPWSFKSHILSGGYVEVIHDHNRVQEVSQRHVSGSVLHRSSDFMHFISHVEPNTWTLVVTGPRIKEWGFYVATEWMHFKDFYDSSHNDRPAPIFRNGYEGGGIHRPV